MNAVLASAPPAPAAAAIAAGPGTAPHTVLCVDDEPNILSALKRVLRGRELTVLTAPDGAAALEMLSCVPVDVVISDMRMPGVDGAQLLEQVHQRWPHVVRVLMTGYADMPSAVAAINRGRIFRYLQKPWNDEELLATVHEGIERLSLQRERDALAAAVRVRNDELQLLNAELESRVEARTGELRGANEKLQRHYLKSIKVFSNLLEMRGGMLAGHGQRVGEMARDIARKMGLAEEEVLRIFVAGLLHDVGQLALCDALLAKPVARHGAEERALYQEHPARGEQSLLALDDMQQLLPMIRAHHERFDGQGFPDRLAGADIPLGARILAVADAFDDLQSGHVAAAPAQREEARTLMRHGRGTQFDPEILDVFLHITEPEKAPKPKPGLTLPTEALESDMVLGSDLISARGVLMLTAGHRLTASLIQRIREFEQREGSKLEINIRPRGLT